MVVRELLTRLNFEADQSKIDKFENSIGNLTKGLALLVTGATAAATAMFSFATASARQSKEIDKGAKLAGMNVEEFQKLAYAAKTFGVEQDKLADILKDVNDKMGDYSQTGGGAMAETKTGTNRNYIKESISNIQKQVSRIQDISFVCCSYEKMGIPENSIIYCDIPYEDTKQYSFSKNFDYDKFWNWAREKSQKGHKVFISEYNAPDDFECIWQQEVKSSLSANGVSGSSKTSVEKLFIFKEGI